MVTVQDVLNLVVTQAQEAIPDSTFKFSSDSHSNREEPFGSDAPGTTFQGEMKGSRSDRLLPLPPVLPSPGMRPEEGQARRPFGNVFQGGDITDAWTHVRQSQETE